jgi:eukaryotic-like serine/threonine-protein kinase
MSPSAGTRLGHYEILTPLGAGGMGEVYRARDTKLNREVAIKVVSESMADDRDRVARFSREAQVLAALNHPNIAHIHGVEDSTGTLALVMELVDGPTLADRIAKGPVALDEALSIAKQIADGLEAAHEQGIVHRDLKPANIKVREDGTVKILDFGLAKALEPADGSTALRNPAMSPTLTAPTRFGVIMGTAAYMSPEQARGRSVDKRSDIWAFGCILYEMLTGTRAFGGEDVSDTLAEVLKSDLDWSKVPGDTPRAIQRLLRRCLEKDRGRRLADIADARLELDERDTTAATASSADIAKPLRVRERLLWIAAIVTSAAIAAGVLRGTRASRSSIGELRLDVITPPTAEPTSFALSPDGRRLVYSAAGPAAKPILWLRDLAGAARPVAGSDGGLMPFWSPDGRSLGFFAGGKLKRVDIDAGLPVALANVITPAGATWNADNVILYVPNSAGSVFRISALGGEGKPLTPRRGSGSRGPHFLPDGFHFIYYTSATEGEGSGVYVADLDHPEGRRLLTADGGAIYGSGHLFFARGGALFSQPFDERTLTLGATVERVADDVRTAPGSTMPGLSMSVNGLLAYRSGPATTRRDLVTIDRTGKTIRLNSLEGTASNPSLSPDERLIAMQMSVAQNTDIWTFEVARGVSQRLTVTPGIDGLPIWSPDGSRIAYYSNRLDAPGLYIMRSTGGAGELLVGGTITGACDWTRDGKTIIFRESNPNGLYDLWAISVADHKRTPLVQSPYDDRDAQLSHDSRWMAYQSDESSQPEIYVQPFPGGQKTRISANGGTQVRWRRDDKEIFYLDPDNRLMAVPVDEPTPGELRVGAPMPLFTSHALPFGGVARQQYVVLGKGEEFIVNTVADDVHANPITIVVNWQPPGARP